MPRCTVPQGGGGSTDVDLPVGPPPPGPCRLQEGKDLTAERQALSGQLFTGQPHHALQVLRKRLLIISIKVFLIVLLMRFFSFFSLPLTLCWVKFFSLFLSSSSRSKFTYISQFSFACICYYLVLTSCSSQETPSSDRHV